MNKNGQPFRTIRVPYFFGFLLSRLFVSLFPGFSIRVGNFRTLTSPKKVPTVMPVMPVMPVMQRKERAEPHCYRLQRKETG